MENVFEVFEGRNSIAKLAMEPDGHGGRGLFFQGTIMTPEEIRLLGFEVEGSDENPDHFYVHKKGQEYDSWLKRQKS